MFRQNFRNLKRIGLRANRLEWPAIFRRCLRFHVPEIHVAGRAEIKDHDAGLVFMARPHGPCLFGRQHLRQRQAHRTQRADLQKLPPFQMAPAANRRLVFAQEIKHNVIPK